MSWTDVYMAVVDSAGGLLEATDYYASGLPVSSTVIATGVNATDRRHIGNRWLPEGGLYMHDNIARLHDPILLCFTTMDSRATDYPHISPFAHCAGNPMRYIDPSGNIIVDPYNVLDYENISNRQPLEDDPRYHVFMHGCPNGVIGYKEKIGKNEVFIVEILNQFIEEITSKSDLRTDSSETIVLHCCYSGTEQSSFAKYFSQEFYNAKVIAPNGADFMFKNNPEEENVYTSEDKLSYACPEWIVFKNGVQIHSFGYLNGLKNINIANIWKEIVDCCKNLLQTKLDEIFEQKSQNSIIPNY